MTKVTSREILSAVLAQASVGSVVLEGAGHQVRLCRRAGRWGCAEYRRGEETFSSPSTTQVLGLLRGDWIHIRSSR
jgi:hypothetical protein